MSTRRERAGGTLRLFQARFQSRQPAGSKRRLCRMVTEPPIGACRGRSGCAPFSQETRAAVIKPPPPLSQSPHSLLRLHVLPSILGTMLPNAFLGYGVFTYQSETTTNSLAGA